LNTPSNFDVIIIGGGLAGLSSAIHLSKYNLSVLLIEKNSYPKHKVCGEYISNKVLPYLDFLDIDIFALGAKKITKLELSTSQNRLIKSELPLGGFGISRYCLDYELAKKARNCNSYYHFESKVLKMKFLERVSKLKKTSIEELQIKKNAVGVPRLFQNNLAINNGFSFTHHGRFSAWSML